MTMNAEQQYIELFSQTEAMICKHSAEVLNAPRAAAFADFERIGFPTRKMEKYKYTDVSKYFEPDFGLNLYLSFLAQRISAVRLKSHKFIAFSADM